MKAASGEKLQFNFAASNALARQIQEGAPADVFISAMRPRWTPSKRRGDSNDTRQSRLSNTLVVVVEADSPLNVDSARALAEPATKRIALADTKGVPAGIYAKEYLEKIGVWEAVKERVVPTENVRAALAAVESGNADAGIVYKTDPAISKAVKGRLRSSCQGGTGHLISIRRGEGIQESRSGQKIPRLPEIGTCPRGLQKYGFIIRQ